MKVKNFFYYVLFIILFTGFFITAPSTGDAKKKYVPEKILYIPHDNRPIVNQQTVELIEKVGYEVVMPPPELLGNRDNLGKPDKLWDWLEKTAKDKQIKAAVLSSDSLLYGSLIGSRKHYYGKQLILERAELFKEFCKKNKKLPVYVFGSIMRTPRAAENSGYQEPDYYRHYGANIFRYTALVDKQELAGLTEREQKEIVFLKKLIPEKALDDWMSRRGKNFDANKKLIDMARERTFSSLFLGRDDNAPYSQTHLEGRNLQHYGNSIGQRQYLTMAGIDEMGLLTLTRAVNDLTKSAPTVYVHYNTGVGGNTIPSYSDEKVDVTINSELTATGAKRVNDASRADFILAVNTNPNGQTYEAPDYFNDGREREGTRNFFNTVRNYVESGKNVAIADIAFANGSDNALMNSLSNSDLLFKIHAYAGWNTPTNSTGFVIGSGILANQMKLSDKRQLLLMRYLDDWAYQANVRAVVANQLSSFRGEGFYGALNDKRYSAEEQCSRLIQNFAAQKMQTVKFAETPRVDFPWNRMFESNITFKVQH